MRSGKVKGRFKRERRALGLPATRVEAVTAAAAVQGEGEGKAVERIRGAKGERKRPSRAKLDARSQFEEAEAEEEEPEPEYITLNPPAAEKRATGMDMEKEAPSGGILARIKGLFRRKR